MATIKYGLKIWSNNKAGIFLEAANLYESKEIDFVELYVVPGSDFSALGVLKKIPTTIHSFHTTHDFDILTLNGKSEKMFKENVIRAADFLASKIIVVHSGGQSSSGNTSADFKKFKKNIAKIKDPRIIIENMPARSKGGKCYFGYSLKELLSIKKLGFDFCLDLAHTYKSALWQKIDYKDFIEELIEKLNPFYFHLSSGKSDSFLDQHLNIFEGDMDIKWIKNILIGLPSDKDVYLVFEVPKIGDNLENDKKNINYFRGLN